MVRVDNDVERDVERCLTLLRDRIRERGFTQLEVQTALGWGRSYISQLLTRQKKLRIEQVLLILSVIGVEPARFFADLHAAPPLPRRPLDRPARPDIDAEIDRLRRQARAVIELLLEKNLISAEDLSVAVATAEDGR